MHVGAGAASKGGQAECALIHPNCTFEEYSD